MALELPLDQRAQVASALLASLDDPADDPAGVQAASRRDPLNFRPVGVQRDAGTEMTHTERSQIWRTSDGTH